jgi:hypothetical protein
MTSNCMYYNEELGFEIIKAGKKNQGYSTEMSWLRTF